MGLTFHGRTPKALANQIVSFQLPFFNSVQGSPSAPILTDTHTHTCHSGYFFWSFEARPAREVNEIGSLWVVLSWDKFMTFPKDPHQSHLPGGSNGMGGVSLGVCRAAGS